MASHQHDPTNIHQWQELKGGPMAHGDLYDESRKAYDLLAHDYALKDGTEQLDDELLNLFLNYIAPNSVVLDLGSGPGQYARRLVALGHKVIAVDNSPEMIRELRRRGCPPGLEAMCTDMRRLDFAEGSFDGVFASASLIHLTEDALPVVLKTLHSILKRDGVLIVNFAISNKGLRFVRESASSYASNGRFFQHFRTAEIPIRYLRTAGFEVVDRFDRVVNPVLQDGSRGRTEWTNLLMRRIETSTRQQ
jgi:SAM-dependent methyltransferase